ncbi:MAG TPA: aminodeoxychorismate synthase component I [Pyrinomonadaceae bacterium]|jgi:para-aminobenzoate synthetase component 1|nr:aminodeoxychorismate synthase component I [Pyrinomonadaceae bacterium]
MRQVNLSAEELVKALLNLDTSANLCLLDSCGVGYGNSHLLVAGIDPVEVCRIEGASGEETLRLLDKKLSSYPGAAAVFTLSYPLGLKLENIDTRHTKETEPDIWIAFFDTLVTHDYRSGKTYLSNENNDEDRLSGAERILLDAAGSAAKTENISGDVSRVTSNISKDDYLAAVTLGKKYIQAGDTYQINLTRQMRADLPASLSPERIFQNLRHNYPAPFSAFIRRGADTVVSASPERFLRVEDIDGKRIVRTRPIKGTRPRGSSSEEDERLKKELLASEKDRAENVMIVDLLRNDLGRVCEFGTVEVEELCALEEHPTFFNLVSAIRGELRAEIGFTDLLRAVFPCGSITGAPKIKTMRIIDEIETESRGLSMGAIGYIGFDGTIDMSVAIRTMTVRGSEAVFNVGGGIVIDSVPELEYEETLVKAKALLSAINGRLSN